MKNKIIGLLAILVITSLAIIGCGGAKTTGLMPTPPTNPGEQKLVEQLNSWPHIMNVAMNNKQTLESTNLGSLYNIASYLNNHPSWGCENFEGLLNRLNQTYSQNPSQAGYAYGADGPVYIKNTSISGNQAVVEMMWILQTVSLAGTVTISEINEVLHFEVSPDGTTWLIVGNRDPACSM